MIVDRINKNIEDKANGSVKAIPCSLERFNRVWPGLLKGDYVCFTGSTSSGKTTLAKKIAVFDSIEYAMKTKLDLHILYFGLEETEEQLDYTILSYLLKKNFNIRYNILDFLCVTDTLPKEILEKIKLIQDEFNIYKSYIHYYDIDNPYGIYYNIREFAKKRGTFISNENEEHWHTYAPNNPNEFIIVIVDHVSLLLPEVKHNNKLDLAMQDLSKYLRSYVSKKFDYTVVAVQQQMAETEDLDHIKNKRWMPTIQGLADNKRLSRDYLTMIGIGNPIRYNLQTVEGYEIRKFKGHLRFIEILKQRYGAVPPEILPIYIDGKCNWIKTAPKPNEVTPLIEHINLITNAD